MDWARFIRRKRWKGPRWKLPKSVLVVVVTGVLLAIPFLTSSSACRFPAVYNFGDSNSDTGAVSATFGRLPFPYGVTFFGKPSGRYSDGRLIIDFIAEKLGLPFLHAYLDSLQANFRHGANFAASGSTIQPLDVKLFEAGFDPLTINVQLSQFEQLKVRSNEYYQVKSSQTKSALPRPKDFSKALYTFDSGQNDLHFLLTSMRVEQVKAYIPSIINQFALAIEKVHLEGARKFWIHNTGPFGCLPFMVDKYPPEPGNADQNGCIKSFNEVAQEFNKQLKDRISQLRNQLLDAMLIHVDIYSAKYTLINDAEKHGFVSPVKFCCRHLGDPDAKCWDKVVVNGTEVNAVPCDDPSKYISWDSIHFTEAANHWIANRIMDGSFSDPPIPLTKACRKSPLSRL